MRLASSFALLALLLPSSIVVTGCRSESAALDAAPPDTTPAPVPWRIVGTSVEERPIECVVLGDGEVTVLLIGGIHGNEEAGTPLLLHLAELVHSCIEPLPWMTNRRIAILPVANPDGLAASTRLNSRHVDLNRNFPSRNFGTARRGGAEPLSEPESRVIHRLIDELRPDRILTFHMPLALVDHDGPAQGLARAMGAVSPLPVRRLGARPGSLGSYAGVDLGIPIVTVELPESARGLELEESWELYGPMILAGIAYER